MPLSPLSMLLWLLFRRPDFFTFHFRWSPRVRMEKLRRVHRAAARYMGPSIYDVHTEGGGGQAQVDGGPAPCGRPHRKLKLEFTDVILSSSHAKKLASFLPEFCLWTEKNWKFVCDIN